jgi:hypothetical protein
VDGTAENLGKKIPQKMTMKFAPTATARIVIAQILSKIRRDKREFFMLDLYSDMQSLRLGPHARLHQDRLLVDIVPSVPNVFLTLYAKSDATLSELSSSNDDDRYLNVPLARDLILQDSYLVESQWLNLSLYLQSQAAVCRVEALEERELLSQLTKADIEYHKLARKFMVLRMDTEALSDHLLPFDGSVVTFAASSINKDTKFTATQRQLLDKQLLANKRAQRRIVASKAQLKGEVDSKTIVLGNEAAFIRTLRTRPQFLRACATFLDTDLKGCDFLDDVNVTRQDLARVVVYSLFSGIYSTFHLQEFLEVFRVLLIQSITNFAASVPRNKFSFCTILQSGLTQPTFPIALLQMSLQRYHYKTALLLKPIILQLIDSAYNFQDYNLQDQQFIEPLRALVKQSLDILMNPTNLPAEVLFIFKEYHNLVVTMSKTRKWKQSESFVPISSFGYLRVLILDYWIIPCLKNIQSFHQAGVALPLYPRPLTASRPPVRLHLGLAATADWYQLPPILPFPSSPRDSISQSSTTIPRPAVYSGSPRTPLGEFGSDYVGPDGEKCSDIRFFERLQTNTDAFLKVLSQVIHPAGNIVEQQSSFTLDLIACFTSQMNKVIQIFLNHLDNMSLFKNMPVFQHNPLCQSQALMAKPQRYTVCISPKELDDIHTLLFEYAKDAFLEEMLIDPQIGIEFQSFRNLQFDKRCVNAVLYQVVPPRSAPGAAPVEDPMQATMQEFGARLASLLKYSNLSSLPSQISNETLASLEMVSRANSSVSEPIAPPRKAVNTETKFADPSAIASDSSVIDTSSLSPAAANVSVAPAVTANELEVTRCAVARTLTIMGEDALASISHDTWKTSSLAGLLQRITAVLEARVRETNPLQPSDDEVAEWEQATSHLAVARQAYVGVSQMSSSEIHSMYANILLALDHLVSNEAVWKRRRIQLLRYNQAASLALGSLRPEIRSLELLFQCVGFATTLRDTKLNFRIKLPDSLRSAASVPKTERVSGLRTLSLLATNTPFEDESMIFSCTSVNEFIFTFLEKRRQLRSHPKVIRDLITLFVTTAQNTCVELIQKKAERDKIDEKRVVQDVDMDDSLSHVAVVADHCSIFKRWVEVFFFAKFFSFAELDCGVAPAKTQGKRIVHTMDSDASLSSALAFVAEWVDPEALELFYAKSTVPLPSWGTSAGTMWDAAIRTLKSIDQFHSPNEMLLCLEKVLRLSAKALVPIYGSVDGDTALSALIYIIIKASPKRLRTQIVFIQQYSSATLSGAQSYTLMQFELSCVHITTTLLQRQKVHKVQEQERKKSAVRRSSDSRRRMNEREEQTIIFTIDPLDEESEPEEEDSRSKSKNDTELSVSEGRDTTIKEETEEVEAIPNNVLNHPRFIKLCRDENMLDLQKFLIAVDTFKVEPDPDYQVSLWRDIFATFILSDSIGLSPSTLASISEGQRAFELQISQLSSKTVAAGIALRLPVALFDSAVQEVNLKLSRDLLPKFLETLEDPN